jgi:protein-tyrosine-phosphatase
MAERGIDISGNSTKHLRRYARARFDAVVTLCDKVREVCPEFPGGPVGAHWSMADPAGEGATDDETQPAFERIAEDLEDRIAHLIAALSTSERGKTRVG